MVDIIGKVRLTSRGVKSVLAGFVLLVFGALIRDYLMLGVAVVLGGFFLYQYWVIRRGLEGFDGIRVNPSSLDEVVTAGKVYSEPLQVLSPLDMVVKLETASSREGFEPEEIISGDNIIIYRFDSVLSGHYSSSRLVGVIEDEVGLLQGRRDIEFDALFRVYPRVFPLAVRAIEYLFGSGRGGEDVGIYLRGGSVGEYAYTRNYVPGDSLKIFDWKAYARTTKPMVKEVYAEQGGGAAVLYDPVVSDRVSLDVLNSEFLKTVIGYTGIEYHLQLMVLEDGEINVVASGGKREALMVALQISLKGLVTEFFEYYSVLDPVKQDKIRGLLKIKTTIDYNNQYDHLIILSALQSNPATIINTINTQATIIQPTQPWLYSPDLEKATKLYFNNTRKIRQLKKLGISTLNKIKDMQDEY